MWRDFATESGPAGLTFGFPVPVPHSWPQLWRDIVGQVEITPDIDSKNSLLDSFINSRGVRTLGFVNAHAMNSCVSDAAFAADLLDLDHIVRDGIGVHALYRLIGEHSGLNLNGTDLLPELIQRYVGKRIALFGTRIDLVEAVAARLRRDLDCQTLVADGFQRDGHYLELTERERPDLVILGMGMPKQERVARLMKHGLHQDVAVVCGGAILDFLSGHRARAPLWMRRVGLEWMYRLSLEPTRLFRRYIVGNPLFLLRSAILSGRPPEVPPPPRPLVPQRAAASPFGIGGPLADPWRDTETSLAAADSQSVSSIAPMPAHSLVETAAILPFAGATSEFSANRPVVERDELFGRGDDLDRLLSWVLDQSGNALIYGPRGYGKTSLVRVFGEIADSRAHVVLYASCSNQIDFSQLMRLYLSEVPEVAGVVLPATGPLTVQQVASRLAALRNISLVIILDEFDRIGRDDTRESIVELIKDVSDLTASVRFVLVGVANDARSILGYHPSVHRCITCVPLTRLTSTAIEELFRRKSASGQLDLPAAIIADVVRLAAGSAYHAQLIGQKLVSRARRQGCVRVGRGDFEAVLTEIISDATLIDMRFARLAGEVRSAAGLRRLLVGLSHRALADDADRVLLMPGGIEGFDDRGSIYDTLVDAGVLQPVETLDPTTIVLRFANAFMPQLILMIDHQMTQPMLTEVS